MKSALLIFVFFCSVLHVLAQDKIIVIHAQSNSEGKIYLLEKKGGFFFIQNTFRCRFGYGGIEKNKVKDGKTPLGHYKVNEERVKSKYDETQLRLFGGHFISIDYPNRCDLKDGKTGSGIGIHGGANKNTRGCIRVLDENGKNTNTKSINEIVKFTKIGTDVFIMDIFPNDLIGSTGEYLNEKASLFWSGIRSSRNCYSELETKMKKYDDIPSSSNVSIGIIQDSDGYTNIRSRNSIKSKIVGTIRSNEAFTYISHKGNWFYISTQSGIQGYIHNSRVLNLISFHSGIAIIKDVDGYTNVRKGPSIDSKVVTVINEYDSFWFKIIPGNWWEVVSKNGIKGYMHKSRINIRVRR
jgi:hypothetical protein